ncbi:nitrate- and nitrite sensing domain-containing protein [Sinosporangium album]|uniref:sensor histidine kinase n=1 Tax=Sinosporangium album TaxID=504805 RepID=UPI000B83EB59|nr:nitrate- and nitrite sensing domain-containing protein [Sinosporangium album]
MRSRLVALILIPTAIGVLMTGVQLADSVETSGKYRRITQIAELAEKLGALTHELGKERTYTAWYKADDHRDSRLKNVQAQHGKVDTVVADVVKVVDELDVDHTARVHAEVAEVHRWARGLPGLRRLILEKTVPARASVVMYTRLIGDLQTIQRELGTDGENERLFANAEAMGALNRVKEEVARQQAILLVGLVADRGDLDYDDLADFLGSWNTQQAESELFESNAAPEDLAFYRATVKGQMVNEADALRQRALAQLREYQKVHDLVRWRPPAYDVRLWYNTTSSTVDRLREVEQRVAGQIVAQTRALQDGAQDTAVFSGVLILILLIIVLVITVAVAGSLVRPLRRLRVEALEIAGTRLPETVRTLRESGDATEPDVGSIGVASRDEIGEVARAFDEVHREAVRLATEEARLRTNINAMFVNLSRRSQTLVERQLTLIEGLEQGEPDENRLADLFKLDHLATRMRRNSENLLVLAGQEAARRWSQPIQIVDVARASLSEVENYERVTLQVQSGVAVAGQAVSDVVHLLAELVENAISFSPRETKVTVASNRIEGGGVMISVSDLGIGMTQEELDQANWRLAHPPTVDVSVSRRMGLFVVGRLALRHGIRVQLRQQEAGGLAAMVLLPDTLIALPPGAQPSSGTGQSDWSQLGGQPNPFEMPNPFDSPFDTMSTSGSFNLASSSGTYNMPATTSGAFDVSSTSSSLSVPAQSNPLDAPVLASPTTFDLPEATSDPFPVRDPFDGDPFDRLAGGDRDPFERAPGADRDRDPFERPPGAERDPFERSAGGERDLFERAPGTERDPFTSQPFEPPAYGGNPVDTAWPGTLPAPGSTSWPNLGDDRDKPTGYAGLGGLAADDPHPSGGWSVPSSLDSSRFDAFSRAEPDDHTGPLPKVDSPMDAGEEEYLPIFAAVESDWFRKVQPGDPDADGTPADLAGPETTEIPAITDSLPLGGPRKPTWSSSADAGWQAAQAASAPSMGGTTSSGLPKRVPKANLVPGSAPGAAEQSVSAAPPPTPLSPERVRSRLSSFQQGVRQARGEISGELPIPQHPDREDNKEGL